MVYKTQKKNVEIYAQKFKIIDTYPKYKSELFVIYYWKKKAKKKKTTEE